jgi:hypothetical protein
VCHNFVIDAGKLELGSLAALENVPVSLGVDDGLDSKLLLDLLRVSDTSL